MAEIDPKTKATWIVEAALDRKAEGVIALDMRELTAYADSFVILTGRSDRQVRSIADAIVHALKERGEPPLGVEGLDDGNWVLIDCNDAIVHVFDPETRVQFDLERLWRDAPRLDLDIQGMDVQGIHAEGAGSAAAPVAPVAPVARGGAEDDRADPAA